MNMPGIIKAGQWNGGGEIPQSVAFNFEDVSHKAQHYLDAVRKQAAAILAQAKQHAQQIREQAKTQGREAALAEAQQSLQVKLEERLRTLVPALEQAVACIRHSQQTWLRHWECQTIRLAAAIAARVIRRELRQSPEITLDLIREALDLAMGGGQVRLHLSPADRDALGPQISAIVAQLNCLAPADIIADASIQPGGCRVVTEFGCVDQQIESQLARIEEELT